MEPEEYFTKVLSIEPYYHTEALHFEPFSVFKYRFQSLQRHWELSKDFIQHHQTAATDIEDDGTAEFHDFYGETIEVDLDFFPEYMRLSTISFSLSLIENLLGGVCEEAAKEIGVEIEFDGRPLPYINKHLLWLVRGCGLELELDNRAWKSLDALRELRNRFLHRIDRDLPEHVLKTVSGMVSYQVDKSTFEITNGFVDLALQEVAALVKRIELGYIRFCESPPR